MRRAIREKKERNNEKEWKFHLHKLALKRKAKNQNAKQERKKQRKAG